MNYTKIIFPLFIVVALVQLFVPAKMIFHREDVLANGKIYKFKTAPIDPSDPFRGKYITLQFAERSITVDSSEQWERGETIFVHLQEDPDGFVKIQGVSKERPTQKEAYVKAKVRYVRKYVTQTIRIEYPFERYYMEESKAYDAETLARRRVRDTTKVVYAQVRILDGAAVLEDVIVNGQRIEDLVKEHQEIKAE